MMLLIFLSFFFDELICYRRFPRSFVITHRKALFTRMANPTSLLPSLIAFDLDDCLWTPEMHELSGMPSIEVEGPLDPDDNTSTLGTVGMKVPSRRGGWGRYISKKRCKRLLGRIRRS